MKITKPHQEVFAEAYPDGLPDYVREIVDGLTHYILDNGHTVSILHSVFGWEAWAWKTGEESVEALTPKPIVYDTEAEALAYRDCVNLLPK